MKEHIKTPRGTFTIRFESMAKAEAAGYSLWFREGDVEIVSNGMSAAAVRPYALSRVTGIGPSAARKTLLVVQLADGWSFSLSRTELQARDIRVGDTLEYARIGDAPTFVLLDRRPPDAISFLE